MVYKRVSTAPSMANQTNDPFSYM